MHFTRTMTAAVLTAPETFELRTVPCSDPSPGEVRIRVSGCGVCGSNLPLWQGRPWFSYPFEPGAPGHEGWGVIDAIGEGVRNFRQGDKVAMLSYHAFAEYDFAAEASVIRLPDTIANEPFPAEPLACALNVFRRCNVQANQTVAVIGIGFLGALLVGLVARARARVIAISRRSFALNLACEMGATETLPLEEDYQPVIQAVKNLTSGAGCDRVIEAVGTQEPLELASELTRERGRLIIAGYHQDGLRQVNMQLWNWRGLDVINAHERDPNVYVAGMQEAALAAARGEINPAPLYTHTYSLDRIGEAFTAMASKPNNFLKALITL